LKWTQISSCFLFNLQIYFFNLAFERDTIQWLVTSLSLGLMVGREAGGDLVIKESPASMQSLPDA